MKITASAYFQSITRNNRDQTPTTGPIIFAANHPSAFMDPILVSISLKQQLNFLARGESFGNPVSRLFYKQLNMIPVYRPTTQPELAHKNKEVFAKCYEYLEKNKSILIFPEGNSKTEPRLRKIKTGAARIALGAEAENDFKLGVKIVPVGINYSNPHHFRSDVLLNFGDPIEVSDFAEIYATDKVEAANTITERIKEALEANTIVIEDEKTERLIEHVEHLYKHKLREEFGDPEQPREKDFLISKDIVNAVEHIKENDPKRVSNFETKVDRYLRSVENLNITDPVLQERKHRTPAWQNLLTLVLGFPLFLAGWAINILPYKLTGIVSGKVVKASDFMGSVLMVVGMLLFSICYGIQIYYLQQLIGLPWALGVLVLLPFIGLFALAYSKNYHRIRGAIKVKELFSSKKQRVAELLKLRASIINDLEAGKREFIALREQEEI